MSANFTPSLNSYTDLTPFRFWCQKILPLVYDDSLSYYELLCKVVDYLNKTMEDVNLSIEDVEKLHTAYESLQGYVNDYFNNLDVQEEINNKLDALVEDGTIHDIFNPDVEAILSVANKAASDAIDAIPSNVTAWLDTHVKPETTVVIDESLTISGAAADAKATGDKISELKSDLNDIYTEIGFTPSERVSASKLITTTRYTTIVSPFGLQEGVSYTAKWTIPSALSSPIYCYISNNNDPDAGCIFPGSTALLAGNTEFSVTFTPSVSYDNLLSAVYTNTTDFTVNFEIDRSEYPETKIEVLEEKTEVLEEKTKVLEEKTEVLEEKTESLKLFEYGHNGLKTSVFMDYNLWSQGVARIDDILVGFNASNDDHSNTANYTSMYYENGYHYKARGNHNLGHCASADYSKEMDVMLVANGTYAAGVVPTIYLVSNAKSITNAGEDILVSNPNVMAIEVTGVEGDGIVACFGESSDIVYAMKGDDPARPFTSTGRYIYKLFMGKGANDMTALYPTQSLGTFMSGKSDNEYNGTAYIMKKYIGNYAIELQGMKYFNGRIAASADCKIDNILTSYLLFIKTFDHDNSFVIDDAKWIPSLKDNGEYVATEAEDFALANGFGYVTILRSSLQTNRSRTLKFSLID